MAAKKGHPHPAEKKIALFFLAEPLADLIFHLSYSTLPYLNEQTTKRNYIFYGSAAVGHNRRSRESAEPDTEFRPDGR